MSHRRIVLEVLPDGRVVGDVEDLTTGSGALPSSRPAEPVEAPAESSRKKPWFALGKATGKVGDTVDIDLRGGCSLPTGGFAVAIGLAGGGLTLVEAKLGAFFTENAKGKQPFKIVSTHPDGRPEPWFAYAATLRQIDVAAETVGPDPDLIPIPYNTILATFTIRINPPPNVTRVLFMKDDHFYVRGAGRFSCEYTNFRGRPHDDVECYSGEIVVTG